METFEWVQSAGILVAAIVGVSLAVAYLFSRVRKQSDKERDRLLELRADRITELEAKVDGLTAEVARLSGMFEALQTLKAAEIAYEVAAMIRDSGLHVHGGAAGK